MTAGRSCRTWSCSPSAPGSAEGWCWAGASTGARPARPASSATPWSASMRPGARRGRSTFRSPARWSRWPPGGPSTALRVRGRRTQPVLAAWEARGGRRGGRRERRGRRGAGRRSRGDRGASHARGAPRARDRQRAQHVRSRRGRGGRRRLVVPASCCSAPPWRSARRFVLPGVGERTEIRLARYGREAGVRGAALLAGLELAEGELLAATTGGGAGVSVADGAGEPVRPGRRAAAPRSHHAGHLRRRRGPGVAEAPPGGLQPVARRTAPGADAGARRGASPRRALVSSHGPRGDRGPLAHRVRRGRMEGARAPPGGRPGRLRRPGAVQGPGRAAGPRRRPPGAHPARLLPGRRPALLRADRQGAGGGWAGRRRRSADPADDREAVRPRPRVGAGAERARWPRPSTSRRCSASTTISARRPCRTCRCCGSPTASSSRSGTAATSSTSRSPSPRTSGSGIAAAYYDSAGALRDVIQNHVMQLLALVAMEAPVRFDADTIRDEKVKLLRSVRRYEPEEVSDYVVRGQYGAGWVGGEEVPAYLDEEGVARDSRTETYVAMRVEIDNWRWAGMPFYLRTGKRLPRRVTEIAMRFRPAPHLPFATRRHRRRGAQRDGALRAAGRGSVAAAGGQGPRPDDERQARADGVQVRDLVPGRLPGGLRAAAPRRPARRRDAVHPRRRGRGGVADRAADPRGMGSAPAPPMYEAGSQGPKEADELLAVRGTKLEAGVTGGAGAQPVAGRGRPRGRGGRRAGPPAPRPPGRGHGHALARTLNLVVAPARRRPRRWSTTASPGWAPTARRGRCSCAGTDPTGSTPRWCSNASSPAPPAGWASATTG